MLDEEDIRAGALVFERESGIEIGSDNERVITNSLFSNSEPDQVECQLKACIEECMEINTKLVGTSIWALGKRPKAFDVNYFKNLLSLLIESDMEAAFQALIVLSTHGDLHLPSADIFEKEKNYEIAKAYLS